MSGEDCSTTSQSVDIVGFIDQFDPLNGTEGHLKSHWDHAVGGKIREVNMCSRSSQVRPNHVVYFDDYGPTLIQTKEINTRAIRYSLIILYEYQGVRN